MDINKILHYIDYNNLPILNQNYAYTMHNPTYIKCINKTIFGEIFKIIISELRNNRNKTEYK